MPIRVFNGFFGSMNKRLTFILPAFVISISFVCVYFAFSWKNSVNLPILDDFNFLDDILRIEDHASWHRKLFSIIAQHNEHRIALSRVVAFCQLHLTGQIDFRWLVLIGNLGLVAMVLFMAWAGVNQGGKFWSYFILVVPVVFSPFQSYQMYSWAMPAISNYWSVAFSIGALACLAWQSKYRMPLAIAMALTAVFTSGQGLVLLPIALLLLLYFRRWHEALIWAVMCFCIWIVYFKLHHIRVENPTNDNFLKVIVWFFVLVGQAPAEAILIFIPDSLVGKPENFVALRVMFGVGTCILAGILFFNKKFRTDFFLLSATGYTFALCAAAAASRSFLPYTYALSSQYRNWSLVIVSLLALGLIVTIVSDRRRLFAISATFSMFVIVNIGLWFSELPFMQAFNDYRIMLRDSFLTTGILYGDASVNYNSQAQIISKLSFQAKPTDMLQQHLCRLDEKMDKEKILWRAHLYGVMPISEIQFDQGIFFDREKLQQIIGDIVNEPLSSPVVSKPLLGLWEESGRYRLDRLDVAASSVADGGFIYLRDKSAMKKTGGWEVLKEPELFLKNKAYSSGDRLFAVLPGAQKK